MTALVPADQTSTKEISISAGAGGSTIAPQNLGEVVRFAEVMCRADIALPPHLRGNAGACMAVALQALEWRMSPFAVASKSYAVKGAIAYEAQLIAAVVNTRSGIQGRLRYEFLGEGENLTCRVTGVLDGQECEYETPAIGAITTKNSPLWKSDPRQQLGYFAARSWARRHCPEVILGVYDRDEAEHFGPSTAKDITPRSTLAERLTNANASAAEAAVVSEGFSAEPDFKKCSSAPVIEPEPSSDPSPDDAPSDEPGAVADTGAGDIEEREEPGSSPAPGSTEDDRAFLIRVFRTMRDCVGPDVDDFKRAALIFKEDIAGRSAEVRAKATTIREKLQECCGEPSADKPTILRQASYLAGVIGVEPKELA